MNFIELRVEDYIDEVLDSENNENAAKVLVLRKFAGYIDRETEVYSLGDLSEGVVLDFLRTIRNSQDRSLAVETVSAFFSNLHQKGIYANPPRLDINAVLIPRKTGKAVPGASFFENDDDGDAPRFRHRRDSE